MLSRNRHRAILRGASKLSDLLDHVIVGQVEPPGLRQEVGAFGCPNLPSKCFPFISMVDPPGPFGFEAILDLCGQFPERYRPRQIEDFAAPMSRDTEDEPCLREEVRFLEILNQGHLT